MKNLKPSNKFDKELHKVLKRSEKQFSTENYTRIINILREGLPIPENYKDHKLQGDLKEFRGLHITPDWVLIYKTDNENIYLHRTGTHSDIYG
jgi:mRNA interferase YafQ